MLANTTDSSSLDIPVRQITEYEHNNHNQEDTSTIST